MVEVTNELSFIDQLGFPISIFYYLESDEDLIAVSSDDRLVKLVGGTHFRVGSGYGCGGTTSDALWEIEELRCLPLGSYELAVSMISTIEVEKRRRVTSKQSWKRWYKNVQGVGYWLFDPDENDDFYINEALSIGIEQYIRSY